MAVNHPLLLFVKKHSLHLFFMTWFGLNLIQAAGTELFNDEAYYWVYSRFLDWGYFDHPPVIALMIKWGFWLFQNEFGVRLLTVLFSTAALVVIHHLLPRKNDPLFFTIACSLAVLQVGSIIAVPDIPLAFFTALFFWVYKGFLQKMSVGNTLLLAVVMALMLYSKYHGVLIIFFTFLSNPRLLGKYQAWLAAIIGAFLFVPHLYWQYTHGFPSVQFHLFERNAASYNISYTLEYVLGQVLLAGPLMGWLVIWKAFRYKPTDLFERALMFSLGGFYLFFLVSTFKGRVEANWTIPAFVPLFILSHQYLLKDEKWRRILLRSVPATLVLVLAVRVFMLLDIPRTKAFRKDEFHDNNRITGSILKETNGLPVVFVNSYQKASKYWFYSGIMAYSLNTPTYRRNNFNFWPVEDSLLGKKIAAVDYVYSKPEIRVTPIEKADSILTDDYYSFSKVKIVCDKNIVVSGNVISNYSLAISSEDSHLRAFQSEKIGPRRIEFWVFKKDKKYGHFLTDIPLSAIREKEQVLQANIRVKLPPGEYLARFALPSALMYPSLNSSTISVKVR